MAVTIAQAPLYNTLPIGQQVIFAISEDTIVATKFKVKFVAEVYVSDSGITYAASELIGTFKTTPNNKGVGIFDLRPVLETFVKPDNEGSTFGNGSRYKQSYSIPVAQAVRHPLHLIDKYAMSENSIKYFAIKFQVEYAESATDSVLAPSNTTNTSQYLMFNGVLQYDDVLTLTSGNYGYNLDSFYLDDVNAKFLTNAPTNQYARLTDYGTLPFLNFLPAGSVDKITSIHLEYYNSAGVNIGSENPLQNWNNGGSEGPGDWSQKRIMYFGAFPGNLRNWSTIFQALVTADTISYYTVQAFSTVGASSELYTINIICPNERGYEGIRLTWLNQWGVWDYYTFNKKSVRSISTNRTSYTQLGGTWNESTFKVSGYKGGKKNFRVNSSEKIKLNTDFVTEAEGVWFEELINSTEVYIVNSFDDTPDTATITNKYIEPVVLTTSSYVKKTIANNKLMQYSIEIEKSKMQRTQSV
tara:strand:- start:801 stop:2210 length:1410 start_codon:yes stop_codon:yes gene_type:complete